MYTAAELMFIATFVYLLASRVMLLVSININYFCVFTYIFNSYLHRLFSFEIWKMSVENCSNNVYSKHKQFLQPFTTFLFLSLATLTHHTLCPNFAQIQFFNNVSNVKIY